jgi:hypothetical protein
LFLNLSLNPSISLFPSLSPNHLISFSTYCSIFLSLHVLTSQPPSIPLSFYLLTHIILSIYLPISIPTYLYFSIYLSSSNHPIFPSPYLYIFLFLSTYLYLSTSLSAYPCNYYHCISLSFHLCIFLPFCFSIPLSLLPISHFISSIPYLSVSLSQTFHLFVSLPPTILSLYLPISVSPYLSISLFLSPYLPITYLSIFPLIYLPISIS